MPKALPVRLTFLTDSETPRGETTVSKDVISGVPIALPEAVSEFNT